jgi:hypothetical protein
MDIPGVLRGKNCELKETLVRSTQNTHTNTLFRKFVDTQTHSLEKMKKKLNALFQFDMKGGCVQPPPLSTNTLSTNWRNYKRNNNNFLNPICCVCCVSFSPFQQVLVIEFYFFKLDDEALG